MGDFTIDHLDEPFAHVQGRHQQFLETGQSRAARQMMEEIHHVGGQYWIDGEEPQIRVLPRGFDVVVAGADMGIAAQAIAFATHDQRELGMGFQSSQTVDDVITGFAQLVGPVQIARLVETRSELDQACDLLTRLRRRDQRTHERRIVAQTVHRHLDVGGQRIIGGLADKAFHRCIETLVRMMHQDIASPDDRKHIAIGIEGGRHDRCPRRVA